MRSFEARCLLHNNDSSYNACQLTYEPGKNYQRTATYGIAYNALQRLTTRWPILIRRLRGKWTRQLEFLGNLTGHLQHFSLSSAVCLEDVLQVEFGEVIRALPAGRLGNVR